MALAMGSALMLAACGGGGGGGESSSTPPPAAASDPRNGSFSAFVTNGTRQTLALDFDNKTYTWSDSANAQVTGKFVEDSAQPGTYVFQSSRITTTANTARFRLAHDAVVGAFPFQLATSAAESYATQPFVAARTLETRQVALDGVYNRFGINVSTTTKLSDISQFQISGGGTTLTRCDDATIYRIETCPSASLQTWQLSPGSKSGNWNMVNLTTPGGGTGVMSIALVGGKKVFLIAGQDLDHPGTAVFRIGLPESTDWPAGNAYGGTTAGAWGTLQLRADSTSTRINVNPNGATTQSVHTYTALLSPDAPKGIRSLTNTTTGDDYFAMQGSFMFAIIGAQDNNRVTDGYLQLDLID